MYKGLIAKLNNVGESGDPWGIPEDVAIRLKRQKIFAVIIITKRIARAINLFITLNNGSNAWRIRPSYALATSAIRKYLQILSLLLAFILLFNKCATAS